MLTIKDASQVRTMRQVKSYRSCPTSTGLPHVGCGVGPQVPGRSGPVQPGVAAPVAGRDLAGSRRLLPVKDRCDHGIRPEGPQPARAGFGKPTRRKRFVDEVSCAYCGGAGADPKYSSASGCPVCRGAGAVPVIPPVVILPPVWRLRPGGRRFNLPDLPGSGGGAGAL